MEELKSELQEHQSLEVKHKYSLGDFNGYSLSFKDNEFRQSVASTKHIIQELSKHPVLLKIRQHHHVEAISPDQKVYLSTTQNTNLWNLQRVCQRNLPTSPYYRYDSKGGAGILILVSI